MFSNGLPVDASVNEIEIYHNPDNPGDDVIRAGTFGRGLWSSPVWHDQPVCDFKANETVIPAGCELAFSDLSSGVPTSWEWNFEGGSPETSGEQHPEGILYAVEGTYSVTLTVSNEEGADTKTMTEYITVSADALPEVMFSASDSVTCIGKVITFKNESTGCPTSHYWSFEPSTVTYESGSNFLSDEPNVHFNEDGLYSVTLSVTNALGTVSFTKEDFIIVGGMGLPFQEDFESGSLASKSWTVENNDFNVTWGTATVGGNEPGNQAAFMNMHDYLVPPGARDRLITPVLSFEGYDEVFLSYQHAYANQFTSFSDSLIVKISDDCGESWTRIFEGGEDNNGSFATHEIMSDPFIPEVPEDWCGIGWGAPCMFIDISPWGGKKNIQIMFETYNHFGNNLYIDNVMVGPMTGLGESVRSDEISVFPNPTNGIVNIYVPGEDPGFEITVFNGQGSELQRSVIQAENSARTDLGGYGKGIFFIRVTEQERITVKKIVVR